MRFTTSPGIEIQYTSRAGHVDILASRHGTRLMKVVNQCPECHRGDWINIVAHSFEEAADLGWITIIPDE